MERPELTPDAIAVTVDRFGCVFAVIPDMIAAPLGVASRTDVRGFGWNEFESCRFPADSWETRTVRTIFEAVIAEAPNELGLTHYHRYNCGHFYGSACGQSAWDADRQTWRNYQRDRHMICGPLNISHDGRAYFG